MKTVSELYLQYIYINICLAFVSCFGDIETGHYIRKNISLQKLYARGR